MPAIFALLHIHQSVFRSSGSYFWDIVNEPDIASIEECEKI
jgi:hypothetical protein